MTAQNAIVDRGVGALVGLAIGDALGTTLEFAARDRAPALTTIVGGGPFGLKPGEWTDDTSMALCLAESLLARDGLDPHDLLTRFLRWYEDGENSVTGRCFDIGTVTRNALLRYRRTNDAQGGSTARDTAGNGSIMRLAPIALRWHDDRERAREEARTQSRTTHGAAEAVEACALLCDILVDAIATGDEARVLAPRSGVEPRIDAIGKGSWRRSRDAIASSGYVVDTLEAALWAVDAGADFEHAVLLAVNLAGDADTVGAVTGQIAGALFGLAAIPEQWLAMLAWRERIESLALRLMKER